ncbi:MAG: molybdopterin biosynthesis protein, partial [Clostridiales bacterium]|nr:molybdopterin biosynthesis protein [Clostridiales bacterium]
MDALGGGISPRAETVRVIDALGRVTSEAVYAGHSSPLYNSAAMDGIAVISARTAGASEASPLTLRTGEDYVIVDTGDPVKKPYDAVIMAEDTQETEGGMIIRASVPAWQHVRPVGEDIVAGEMILTRCHTIRPMDIGVLLSGGVTEISVFTRPKVGIIPTGSEIVEPYEDPEEGD